MRHEPADIVRCEECYATLELARRNVLEHARRGITTRCVLCRRIGPLAPATEADRRFWLDTLGLDEAQRVAGMIWTDDVVDV